MPTNVLHAAFIQTTDPSAGGFDPSSVPTSIYAGPYGFLVAIFFFGFMGLREFRRMKEVDNTNLRNENTSLKGDVDARTNECNELRDRAFTDAQAAAAERAQLVRAASLEQERLLRENALLRARLADHGLPSDLPADPVLGAAPATTVTVVSHTTTPTL